MPIKSDYDIVIVGGGVVGLTFAAALAHTSLRLAILDRAEPASDASSDYDLRVSAINLHSQAIWQNLAIWPTIAAAQLAPFREIQVWDAVSQANIHFSSQQIAEPHLGHIIEQRVMLQALQQHLQEYKNISFIRPVQPTRVRLLEDSIELTLQTNEKLSAQLLVGADGAHSWVRQEANIAVHQWSYQHHALVTTIATELPHQATAWQCFWSEGPLALLPLADPHHCSIVWSTTPDHAKRLLTLTEEDFNRCLTAAFCQRLGKLRKLDKLLQFPLHMRHAKHYVKPHLALIGDAAHTIHPLAGQGVNLGIADALFLAQNLEHSWLKGRGINDWQMLRRYERNRKAENWRMIAFLEFFKRLFASRIPLTIYARAVGLNFTNQQQLLKNYFVRQATGKKRF